MINFEMGERNEMKRVFKETHKNAFNENEQESYRDKEKIPFRFMMQKETNRLDFKEQKEVFSPLKRKSHRVQNG